MESGNPIDRALSELVRRRLQITDFFSKQVDPIKSRAEQHVAQWWQANPVISSVDRSWRPFIAVSPRVNPPIENDDHGFTTFSFFAVYQFRGT